LRALWFTISAGPKINRDRERSMPRMVSRMTLKAFIGGHFNTRIVAMQAF
jgi:hypothetical protein